MPNRIPTRIGGLMLAEALTFAIASIVHFGVLESFLGAAIPEAIIAVVLGAAAINVMRRPAGSWWPALTTTLFALVISVGLLLTATVRRVLRQP